MIRKLRFWNVRPGRPTCWLIAGLIPAGVQLAFAAGVTQSLGTLNIPFNLAVAPGRRGASISFTTGFNYKRGS